MKDYTTVTESPGNRITRQALDMMCTRYVYAAGFCEDRNVLEVGCGAGQGLGYLARKARQVVGGDYTGHLLRVARDHYQGKLPLVQLDAQELPFQAASFDVVILYEALYYLAEPEKFLEACRRILRPAGTLLLCTVNKEWSDFNPSPFSTQYLSAEALCNLFKTHQFDVELYGAFQAARKGLATTLVSFIKRTAIALHLMPKTMRGKALFKRLFLGPLVTLPAEIEEGMVGGYAPPVPLSSMSACSQYKVLYAVARAR